MFELYITGYVIDRSSTTRRGLHTKQESKKHNRRPTSMISYKRSREFSLQENSELFGNITVLFYPSLATFLLKVGNSSIYLNSITNALLNIHTVVQIVAHFLPKAHEFCSQYPHRPIFHHSPYLSHIFCPHFSAPRRIIFVHPQFQRSSAIPPSNIVLIAKTSVL